MQLKSSGNLSDEELVSILDNLDTFEFWLKSIKGEALRRLLEGATLPGRKLVLSRKNRRWTDRDQAKLLLRKVLEEDEYNPRSLLSPTQIEKLLKRNKMSGSWNLIAEFVETPRGEPTMTDEGDPRPTYTPGSEFEPVE